MILITSNASKVREFQRQLPGLKKFDLDLDEIQSLSTEEVVRHKIEQARSTPPFSLTHGMSPILVEDTSLAIDGMNGLPGPFVKWFIKSMGNEFLVDLAARHDRDGAATATTVIGCCERTKDGDEITLHKGVIRGHLCPPRTSPDTKSFSWDSVFQPLGYDKTFGQMTPDEKDEISHRSRAISMLKAYLNREK